LVAEKAMSPTFYTNPGWYWDEPYFTGGSGGTARNGDLVLLDSTAEDPDLTFRGNWGSAHPAGVNMLLTDGSVRTLPYSTPPGTVSGLLTPAGGEILNDF
jgi:hypothetical protein